MKLFSSLSVSAVALAACIAGTGCAGNASAPDDSAASTGEELGTANGVSFTNITANGTGCPAGSWDAAISPDGQTFTVTFSSYEAIMNPGQAIVVKDCTLGIDFHSPSGLSVAVSDFYYQGYALLDSPGMTGRQTAKYYFMGNPVPAREARSDMAGPHDDSYLFQDTIATADLVWSPCGATRRLNAQTRLVLQNNAQKTGSAYLNTESVDGHTGILFRWNFLWRGC
jgi:hypothetical protein